MPIRAKIVQIMLLMYYVSPLPLPHMLPPLALGR